ncbi:MAG: cytochrome c3 family protein [Desulfuromonadaceae bacterium]
MKRLFTISYLTLLLVVILQDFSSAQTCSATSCHQSILNKEKHHSPVQAQECLSCHHQKNQNHPILGGKSWELVAKVPALCEQCHTPFGKKKMMHSPVKDGDCIACHKPHGGSGQFLLDVRDDRTELCITCHDPKAFKQPFMHGPVAVGACNKCHQPHESNEKALLNAPVRNVCLTCHTDFAKDLKQAKVTHPPVKDGPCTVCHNPHGSSVSKILKQKIPDLCVGCHDKIGKKLAGVKVPHKPLSQEGGCSSCHSAHYSANRRLLPFDEMSTCLYCHDKDNLGTPPLRNIKKDIEGKKFLHGPIKNGQCAPCHDPHGSDNFRMLRGSYPAEIYVPYKEGVYGACLSCHEKNLLRFADTTIYTKFRNGKRNLHYVHIVNNRKSRTCRVCHQPHASNGEKLIDTEVIKFGVWTIPVNLTLSSSGGRCAPGCHQAFAYDRDKPAVYKTYSTNTKRSKKP